MSDDIEDRIDRCLTALGRQNGPAISAYARRVERRLARVAMLVEQRRASRVVLGRDPLERWAERVCVAVTDEALLACDLRLEQSLSDLVAVLEDDLRSLPSR